MNGTMGFLLAVGGVSTIIYWLSNRADRAARRSSTGDGSGSSYELHQQQHRRLEFLESDEQLFE